MNIERKHIVKMLEYCQKKWGKSDYHRTFPKLRVHKKSSKYDVKFGEFNYETNTIYLYLSSHDSVVEMCDTIVHEYTHYLQNMDKMYDKYMTKYYKRYDNHPYEITAVNRGKKYKWECLKYIW